MASYLQIENISKSYGPKILFENIGFNINEGDKIALIAPNGTGKTSLLRILAGKDKSDSGGQIKFLKDIRIAFLEQEYEYDPEKGIMTQVMDSSKEFTKNLDQDHFFNYELKTFTPTVSPSRSLKFATDLRAWQVTGFWPVIAATSLQMASISLALFLLSPQPTFTITFSSLGICIALL